MWNSTYLMLDTTEKFQAAFVWLQYHDVKCNKHFEKEKIKGPPEKEIEREQGCLLNS